MSERRACRVIDADRKSMRYRSKRGDDAELRVKLRELAQQRRRFGYRRLHILLRRDGVTINRKKTQRLYREEGLAVRRRRNRRRAVGRSEEHTSELQSLMRISYAVFCLKKKINIIRQKAVIVQSIYN